MFTNFVFLNVSRKFSLTKRRQKPCEALGKCVSTASTKPLCLSDSIVSLGMFSVFTPRSLRNSDMNHIQLSSLSVSTTAIAKGNSASSASTAAAQSSVPRYFPLRCARSSSTSGLQAFINP
ncbi:hypothetical protein V8G54_032940 [Vigna mungo]|uniref:Uncharacterized protein n=1 Tax=Vigna mungo TaxID=3915 RepID=A0AAQ3RIE4_VIGMU